MDSIANDHDLYAHLMRRAGFGARLEELDVLASRPYEDVVDDLLHPERFPDVEVDVIERFYSTGNAGYGPLWWYRMLNSPRQLEEKMTLFWHHIFATGQFKSAHNPSSQAQIDMFRRLGMTNMRTLLTELSKDPAMIFWLDNNENLKDEPNENYGRELLELFSMGVGNYTEEDVKAAAYAFTGWTLQTPIPGAGSRYGGYHSRFVFTVGSTTTPRRNSSARRGDGTVRTSWTSSSSNPPPRGSYPGTCTTTSWPTNLQCRAGTKLRPKTLMQSTCSRRRT